MSLTRGTFPQTVTVRAMHPHDLSRLVQIEKQTPCPLWTLQNFQTDLQAGDRINLVALRQSQVVGFLIARVIPEIEPGEETTRTLPGGTWTGPAIPKRTLNVNLLHMAVALEQR